MTTTTFREVQQFRQKWLIVLLVFIFGVVAGTFGYGMIAQLVFGNPWGDEPMSDTMLAVVGPIAILLAFGFVLGLYNMKLVTEVSVNGLRIQMRPFVNRTIALDEIVECEARTYNSLVEYGGWGVRWRPGKGMAYNTSGNKGVQVRLSNGKSVMIGSHRAEELASAILDLKRS